MAYSGITISIPIEENMAHPEKYNTVLHITIVFLTILYCGFAVLTYAFFGNDVHSVVTKNLRDDWEAYLPKVGLIIMLLMGIPIQLFAVYQIIEKAMPLEKWGKKKSLLITSLIRVAILLGTAGLGILVPYFGLFTNLVGALCGASITYVFPPIFHLFIFYRAKKLFWPYVLANSLILFLGVFGGGLTSVETIISLVQAIKNGTNASTTYYV